MILVGVTGPAGAGKSAVAKYLQEVQGFRRERFAGPLKDMLRAVGLSDAQVDGDDKETPTPLLCGKTPRWAMQTLGTEWGRRCVHPDLWVALWRRRLRQKCAGVEHPRIVVDDLRFKNEARAIHEMGGVVIRVTRERAKPFRLLSAMWARLLRKSHVSEAGLPDVYVDRTIVNDSTLEALKESVEETLVGMELPR